ncbi:MAG: hypothetical protein NC205_02870 [Prevotella sp.]|nr:hypothetical protein [Alistipes senegalensis]MCM1357509.1 hypothetical protein [Prevotella sp.]MCM1472832.1 hypothetical protein [Muribaculaceae bacterium]
MKILNIHGYKGSAENSACMTLKKLGHEVISPQIDYDSKRPRQILRDLIKIFDENKPDYIVGTSLGGFFALLVAKNTDVPAVLVSPCLNPCVTLSELGYKMDKSRKMTFIVFKYMIEKMNFHNITAIIGGQDEIISYHDYTKKVIKNNYVVPEGKHSGATLNLDYWLRRFIK